MTIKQAVMDRSHNKSLLQKSFFAAFHLLIVFSCAWLIYFDGWTQIGNLFGKDGLLSDPNRATVLFLCVLLYWLRHLITLFYLLSRKVSWSEVFGLLAFFILFEVGLVLVGGGAFRDDTVELGWFDILALLMLLSGSLINSYSEMQRKWWKAETANKGHCYTQGLFRHSMHINFFGDIILFSGWCLLTASLWTLALPLFMAISFIFFHIPDLDNYLAHRYGEEFNAYAKTKLKSSFLLFIKHFSQMGHDDKTPRNILGNYPPKQHHKPLF